MRSCCVAWALRLRCPRGTHMRWWSRAVECFRVFPENTKSLKGSGPRFRETSGPRPPLAAAVGSSGQWLGQGPGTGRGLIASSGRRRLWCRHMRRAGAPRPHCRCCRSRSDAAAATAAIVLRLQPSTSEHQGTQWAGVSTKSRQGSEQVRRCKGIGCEQRLLAAGSCRSSVEECRRMHLDVAGRGCSAVH